MKPNVFVFLFCLFFVAACHSNEPVEDFHSEHVGEQLLNGVRGMYLLNEGAYGTNTASLDYYDFTTATYHHDLFSTVNPSVSQGLGDIGSDICIYGSRLYAVINGSHLIEVMDASSARHIGTISVPNCRYLCFRDGYGYVTSYAGPVLIGTNDQIGYVARFDTATLQIIDTCHVGFQPDQLAFSNGKLYVANSGGYLTSRTELTVSVIKDNHCIGAIPVAKNLQHVCADSYQQVWVSSQGDYNTIPSRLYCISSLTDSVIDSINISVSNMWLQGDSLYVYGAIWSYTTMDYAVSYHIVNVRNRAIVASRLFSDPTIQVSMPYGLAVHPLTHEIYLTDAKDYVTPGKLWAIRSDGSCHWSVTTGMLPSRICFLQ